MITGSKVRLRSKKLADAGNDYVWQSSPELARLDAAPQLTLPFAQYLIDYTGELQYPTPGRRVFAVETFDGRHIGNCVYYHINNVEGEAEVGVMIGDADYQGKGYGTDAVRALVNHIFAETSLKRLYLKTLDWNKRAQGCFEKCGFISCGGMTRNGYSFILMELNRDRWEKRNDGN